MRQTIALLLLAAALAVAGCSGYGSETGTLKGTVTIGPISPVQKEGVKEEVPPEVYAARKVMVYNASGNRLVEQVDLNDDGTYSVRLGTGTYTVDINRVGVDSRDDVPRKIEIRAEGTVVLDIDIDTGIR